MSYYTKQDTEQFTFIKTPRFLFQNPKYITLSAMAKLMYGLILDRLSVSRKNNWIDQQGYVYIIYTVEETAKVLNCSEDTATKVLRELSDEGAGLITRKRRGQGKPSVIYVYNIPDYKKENSDFTFVQQNVENDVEKCRKLFLPISETDNAEVKSPTSQDSRVQESRIQEAEENGCNQNNSNQTEYNQPNVNHLSANTDDRNNYSETTKREIKNNIGYDDLVNKYGNDKATQMLNAITSVLSGKKVIKSNGQIIETSSAISAYKKINHEVALSVLDTMASTAIYSPQNWLPVALYNAVNTPRPVNCKRIPHGSYQLRYMPTSQPSYDIDAIIEHAKNMPLTYKL